MNYAILRVVTYQNYNNSKQYMYHQLPNFFCLKEMGEINNSWLVYKNPILRHGDTQYYFTHVATLLRTILQHFSICFKEKKVKKILVYIWNTVYKVKSHQGICNLTHRFIGQTCNFRSEIVERQNSMVSFLQYFPAFKVPHGFLLSLPSLCKLWNLFSYKKACKD